MDAVAEAAGVSKGGLLYHFRSQKDLAVAMCEDSAVRLRESVIRQLTPADQRPGRLLRAYVRALLGEDSEAATAIMHFVALTVYRDFEEAQKVFEEDAQQWRNTFNQDGIESHVWLTVRLAAEGAVACLGTAYLDSVEREALRQHLFALSEA